MTIGLILDNSTIAVVAITPKLTIYYQALINVFRQ